MATRNRMRQRTPAGRWTPRPSKPKSVVPGQAKLVQEPAQQRARAIVAGYDGTPASRAAVAEAARRAGRDGRVFVVYAYRQPPAFLGSPYFEHALTRAQEAGRRALAEFSTDCGDLPESEYIPELIAGAPADAIARVASARDAEAIVVGARRNRLIGALLGGIAGKLRRRVEVPVLTVPDPAP